MKKSIFIIGVYIFAVTSVFSQDMKQVIRDNSYNYWEIQKSIVQDPSILENESPRFQKEFAKWNRYWRTRVDSSGSMKPFMQEMSKIAESSLKNTARYKTASSSNNYWTCEGPNSRPSGINKKTIGQGLVSTIWVNPNNHDEILIGASNAGIWKTTNHGINWTCLTEGLMTGGIKDIAVDPLDNDIIYIVTQVRINNSCQFNAIGQYSLGIFKTTDGGTFWQKLNTFNIPEEEYFVEVLIHHPTPTTTTLYALTVKEVYKSTNAGLKWAATGIGYPALDTYGLEDIEFHPDDPETLYVSGSNALYKTNDGGDNWISLMGNLNKKNTDAVIALAVDENNSDDLYVLYRQDHDSLGVDSVIVELSSDEGANFQDISTHEYFNLWADDYISRIWVAPDGDVFAGGIYIHRSRNGGEDFSANLSSNLIHDDKRDCCFPDPSNGNLIYLATDGGVYMDANDGDSWENITGDLPINEFVSLAITTQDPNIMFGGTMDCGSYLRNQDGSWAYLHGCDGGTSLLDQDDYNIYYYTCNGWTRRVDNSVDPSTSTLIDSSKRPAFDAPIIMDPTDSDVLYRSKKITVSSGPYVAFQRSLDKGDNWSTLMMMWYHMTDMTICESNPDTYYFTIWSESATTAKIYKTINGGVTHSEVAYSGMTDIMLEAPITNIVVNPFDENLVWVTYGGSGTLGKKVYYSSNGGTTWNDITGTGLPDLPVQCFVYDFFNSDLYVGTDVGVYSKSMNDIAWQMETDFPRVLVSDLLLNHSSGDLIAGTYGRGVWRKYVGDGNCFNDTDLTISNNYTLPDGYVCSNIIVASGGTLTITGLSIMDYQAQITVESNGLLKIDGGDLKNGNITIEDGGKLEITDDGFLHLHDEDNLQIDTGGELDIEFGEINVNSY